MEQLHPPSVWAQVEENVYRTNVFYSINHSFVAQISPPIKTVLWVSKPSSGDRAPDKVPPSLHEFCQSRGIALVPMAPVVSACVRTGLGWKAINEVLVKETLE